MANNIVHDQLNQANELEKMNVKPYVISNLFFKSMYKYPKHVEEIIINNSTNIEVPLHGDTLL